MKKRLTIPLFFDDNTEKWRIEKTPVKGRLKINLDEN